MHNAARPSTRQLLRREQTRGQIVNAAKQLFMKRGYHNTSLNDVLEASATKKGAFFYYWKTKERLALDIVAEMNAAYEAQIFTMLHADGSPSGLVAKALERLRELNRQPDWPYCRLLATWCMELDPADNELGVEVHALRRRWLDFWEQLLTRAQREGELRGSLPAKELSFLMMSTLCGVSICERNGGGLDHDATVETLRRLMFG